MLRRIVNYAIIEKRSCEEDFDSDNSSASVQSTDEIWNLHNSDVVFSPTVLSVYFLTVENSCKAWVKALASFFRGEVLSSRCILNMKRLMILEYD